MIFEKPRIAVIGKGVIGLTTAELLLENGYAVDIFSKDDQNFTASMGAGAYWWPHKAYPAKRVSQWSGIAFKKYKNLSKNPETGIKMHQHYRFCSVEDETSYALELVDNWSPIDSSSFGITSEKSFTVEVPLIDVSLYMPWLYQRVKSLGARFYSRELNSCHELTDAYQLVINCSGLNARILADDPTVYPIRGQIVRVEKPENFNISYRHVTSTSNLTLILPRFNDCILGGTSLEHSDSTEVDKQTTTDIINRCSSIVPELKNFKIMSVHVALRPGRESVRLEPEITGNKMIIHNYGHGGSGYTISYGCAQEVLSIAKDFLGNGQK